MHYPVLMHINGSNSHARETVSNFYETRMSTTNNFKRVKDAITWKHLRELDLVFEI